MEKLLFVPPITFLVVLGVMTVQLAGVRIFSAGLKDPKNPGGRFKSYACGEDVKNPRVQPDYSQFFPFAFFFTIMHVVALIVATIPVGSLSAAIIGCVYLIAAAIGLFILFRR